MEPKPEHSSSLERLSPSPPSSFAPSPGGVGGLDSDALATTTTEPPILSSEELETLKRELQFRPTATQASRTALSRLGGNTHQFLQTKPKVRRSWVYKHGTHTVIDGKGYWQCSLCPPGRTPKRYVDSSTKHPIDHLRTHRMSENGPISDDRPNTLPQTMGNTLPQWTFNIDLFRAILIQWMVTNDISFHQVEDRSFRLLLGYLAAVSSSFTAIPRHLPKSSTTISSWIETSFRENKDLVRRTILESVKRLHFSFDIWSSENGLNMMGIVGHWISQDGDVKQGLLGLRGIEEAHMGKNQWGILWRVLEEYDLLQKIGYFTLNNAENNDTILRALGLRLGEKGISFNPKMQRLQCFGHIINLVVKTLLYRLEDSEGMNQNSREEEWRKIGAYGRLRNIIKYILWTPQRRQEFISYTQVAYPDTTAFLPITANQTWWSGDYRAIKRALELHTAIDIFATRHVRDGLGEDQLEFEHWKELKDMQSILEPIHRLTSELEGRRGNGALYDVFPAIDILLEQLQNAQKLYSTPGIQLSLKLAWSKLDTYYTLADFNPVLYAAIALHPAMKYEYFEFAWSAHPAWIATAKSATKRLWEEYYKFPNSESVSSRAMPPLLTSSAQAKFDFRSRWKLKRAPRTMKDELEEFTSTHTVEIDNPCKWWAQHKLDYPLLSQMALDILAIPAMSSEVERVFSSTGVTVMDRPNGLTDESVESIECQKSWFKSGLLDLKEAKQLESIFEDLEHKTQGTSEDP